MNRAALTVACVAVAWTIVPAAQAPQEPQPTFRGGVELMNLSITVTDKRGRSITDLTQDDFEIFEDGKRQDIVSFGGVKEVKEATPTPIGLGLVLDGSQSMSTDKLQGMRTAVELMFKRLRPEDEVFVADFATQTILQKAWTTDKKAALDAVRRIKTRPGTAMYNAILDGLEVSKAGTHKKQVLLVITDGADTHSTVKRSDVALLARASDVIIYGLVVDQEEGFGRATRSGMSDANLRSAAGELSQVTDATGGRTQYVQGFGQLEEAITEMGKEFTQQYEIAYARARPDNKFHEIRVGVKRKDITVRHRRAYLAR